MSLFGPQHIIPKGMMLRGRQGTIQFKVVNKEDNGITYVKLDDYLTSKQKRRVSCYPDFTWQFAQWLKKEYAEKGMDVQIFVQNRVKINDGKYYEFIDPDVDLAGVPWKHFSHNEWICPSQSQ